MTVDASANRAEMESSSKKPIRKPQPAAPRKRRRRAVVSGAAEDCFTCSKRGARCDRRRPYCSQCLELGRECSGYKTKLTWDVGVASRGKLRGLSLPVMGAKPAQNPLKPTNQTETDGQAPIAQSTETQLPLSEDDERIPPTMTSFVQPAHSLPSSTSPVLDASANSAWVGGTADPHTSPIASSQTLNGGPLNYNSIYQQNRQGNSLARSPQFSCTGPDMMARYSVETMAASLAVHQWSPQSGVVEEEDAEDRPGEHRASVDSQFSEGSDSLFWARGHTPSFSQMLLARSVGRTPRLKYLISYYSEVIAPVIVTFDSPTNPFRNYILSLAQESDALQEAIATLSSSNLKQRRMRNTMSKEKTLPARMSSMAHRALTDRDFQDRYGISISEGFNREELHHRGLAVKALNAQLADPTRRLSDSALAALLILCLYHACDTGVAQFKTQFAGVMKLLALRMRSSQRASDELKWFIRIFTWFDTMTATINDRDAQLRGACLDTTAVSDGEWGLENLAGLDGGLFKLIAQLGRLNLLSQQKPIDTPAPADIHIPTTTLPPSMLAYTSYSFNPNNFFGAGIVNAYGLPYQASVESQQTGQPSSQEFWAEWYSLRQRLESWRLDTSALSYHTSSSPSFPPEFTTLGYMSPPSSPSQSLVAPQHLEDLFNISESFRHSALLYTERLAYPDLPSSHPRIQNIVQVALRYISAVQSDVYLLWPLFITGAECVHEAHRTIIRNRCSGIENDSGFFNNLSCLELLEKVWAQNPSESGSNDDASAGSYIYNQSSGNSPSANGRGFKWQSIIRAKRDDEEYMVV